jgi:tetratricopeptide (TPR) repeat protein
MLSPLALLLCALALPAQQPPVPAEAQAQYAQAEILLQQNRIAEAEVALTQAHTLAPANPVILTLLARVKSRLGESAPSIALFEQVAALAPRSPQAHLDLAIALSDGGNLPRALDETALAIKLAPTLAAAHLNRARILADLKRQDDAAAEFATAARLDPGNPDTFFYWALVERERSQLHHEAELLERAVKLQPDNEKAWFLLGRSLNEQGRRTEAIPALRHAVALDPRAESATYMLARALRPTDPAAANELMARFNAARQADAALEASKRLGDEANQAAAGQQWPGAIRLYRQALATCGECEAAAALHKNLGLAFCRSGDIPAGRAELEQARQLNPNDPDILKALEVLNQ